ncbi:MAG: DUF5683 domain-containing protein [Flavobacteriaceae bacterium]|nr:DUF5683 domain-containing protein [Flavobacteriaceae bacterium]
MKLKITFFSILILFFSATTQAQEISIKETELSSKKSVEYNPLSPAKAAFYSAVLPGLGQAYNKKYWKIPFVYAAIGTSIYVYDFNNTAYNRYRTAYKLRLAGKQDEFTTDNGKVTLSVNALITAQKGFKKDRDLSLLVTTAFYILQIVEASVNAHLMQFNIDENLSFNPQLIQNDFLNKPIVGASLKIDL